MMPHKSALCFRLWSEFIQRILYCVKKNISLADSAAVLQHIGNADNGTDPATKAQQELISSLLKDFSDIKNSYAFEKYRSSPTQKNASKFIEETIEHNADIVANKKNYMGYLANRPGAVKFGSHGLFSQSDEPISLKKVVMEVAEHKGNVWTHVVSLRRDDAQKMCYDNLTAWRELMLIRCSMYTKSAILIRLRLIVF